MVTVAWVTVTVGRGRRGWADHDKDHGETNKKQSPILSWQQPLSLALTLILALPLALALALGLALFCRGPYEPMEVPRRHEESPGVHRSSS